MIGDENAHAVLNAMIAKAIKGDVAAADILLKRAWPVRKGAPVKIDSLPRIVTLADVNAALAVITSAMAEGELSAEEGHDASSVIENQRKVLESIDFEARISALERARGVRNEPS